MDWFRAHHGISNDSKLALISKRAKVRKCEVLAVWVAMLDYASQNETERGSVAGIDSEELSVQIDVPVATINKLLDQFRDKEMVTPTGTLTAWDKRQYTDPSTERVRRHRENKRLSAECNGVKRAETVETVSETFETDETPRADTEQIQNKAEQKQRERESRALTLAPKGIPNPNCQDFGVRFDALYIAHPRAGFREEAKFLYVDIITTSVNPDAVADDIDAKHKLWLAHWLEHAGFIPSLAQWLRDRYYLKEPRSPPKKALTQSERWALEDAREKLNEHG